MEKELLYELILQDEEDGVFANSFVESPAIERDFVFFGKEIHFQAVSDEKRLVAGAMLIPNKKILRLDGEGNPYYVYFTPETIEMIARKFMKNKFNGEVTVEHGKKVNGVYLTESWIVEQSAKDKSNIYGFTLPKGTWFGIYKVDNDSVWEKVKNGTFKGYSIEGLFEHRVSTIKLSLEKEIDDLTDEEAEIFLSEIKALIKKDRRYKAKQRIEMESYSDYPQSVRDAARIAREQNEKVGNKCMTLVGKRRAADLEAGRPVSRETISRMVSYLSRAKDVYEQNKSNRESCSYIAYKGWGGETALKWAENKLKQIDLSLEELKEGVPHYTADGKLYEGPTHKDAEGRLMTGAVHTEDSEYLYHREELEAQPSITSSYPGEVQKKKKKDESK